MGMSMKGIHNVKTERRYCNSLLSTALCSKNGPDGALKELLSHTCPSLCSAGAVAALEVSDTIPAL